MGNSIPVAVSGHNFLLPQGILECRLTGHVSRQNTATEMHLVGSASPLFPYKNGKREDMENVQFINIWSTKRTFAELALVPLLCH